MFEDMITKNTVEDEPNAPCVRVINAIDDEPSPPWEFYYSNKVFYEPGLLPPNKDELVSCNCIGGCRPDSKTCACLKKQNKAWDKDDSWESGFAYGPDGAIRGHGIPVFECNENCLCDADCCNRVCSYFAKFPLVFLY
jgi:histone-lysine N-methyltransferase SUV39H